MTKSKIPEFDRNGWPLPNEFLMELGRIATMWAYLESSLDMNISKLAGSESLTDMRNFILITHANFPQKLDMLSSLCEYLIPQFPRLKMYPETIVELKKAQKLRNRYLHNGMTINEQTGKIEMGVGTARGKLKTSVEVVTLDELKIVPIEINSALRSLHHLITGKKYPPIWELRGGT